MNTLAPILIIGAGQAGATAAATLRALGHAGRIVLVGDELHAPYERPPLSKSVLSGEQPDDQIGVHPAAFYADSDIELQLGREVAYLDAENAAAVYADGSVQPYSRCLLATGGRARELPELPAGTPGVHYIRSLDDARGLRTAIAEVESVLIIGGGFLGLETAATALALGRAVTLVETGSQLLPRAVPAMFSAWLATRARQAGLNLMADAQIAGISRTSQGITVTLTDGLVLQAPLVVVAIGLVPETRLARTASLELHASNGGIRIDAQGRTSAAHIYAAGDCASQYQPLFQKELRLESWQSANEQARLSAAAMLDTNTSPQAVPWFWTDQFGCNIQMLGAYDPDLDYALRGSTAHDPAPKFVLLGMEGDRLRHALAVNAGGDLRQLRPLLEQDAPIDAASLQNTTLTLRQLVRDALSAHADASTS